MSDIKDTLIETSNIPIVLRNRSQWVCWKREQRNGKTTKVPYCPATGSKAESNDPNTWANFDQAMWEYQQRDFDGIGFVFSAHDPFCGVDLDHCITELSEVEDWATEIVSNLDSYTEVSPSGDGLHIIVEGAIEDQLGNRCGNFECYDRLRYFTITGRFPFGLDHSINIEPRQEELNQVRVKNLRQRPRPQDGGRFTCDGDYPAWEDDFALLEKSFSWKKCAKYKALSEGDTAGYGSASEADLAFCNHLAWLLAKDPRRVDRAFRHSGLLRQKWDTVHVQGLTYGAATINKAISGCKTHYKEFSGYDLNEDGIALAFAEKHKDELRFDHHVGKWFVWTGSHWKMEETKLAFTWSRDLVRKMNFDGDAKLAKAATAAAVERYCRADRTFAVTSGVWDQNPFLLGTPDGTLDLRSGAFRPGRRDDFITRITACSPENSSRASLWTTFLQESTRGDQELIGFLKRVCGYMLTGDVSEHALFFVYGPGGNGKSVFLNTIHNILGDYATTSSMDTFTASKGDRHPTDLAMLKGARLVSASETEEGRAWAESRIKQLTGGDKISARFMRQDFFTYQPQFKLLIVGNHKPQLQNVDEAARRRFNIIPFIHKPAQPDRHLEEKLKAEYRSILGWMVEGCMEWQQCGLGRPQVVMEATDAYFDDQDIFGQWLAECCETGGMKMETSGKLFASWKAFAESHGENPGSTKIFSNNMAKRGFPHERKYFHGKQQRAFVGVRLIPPQEEWKPFSD
jgi:P4 family phage/plasmid primase-like protien